MTNEALQQLVEKISLEFFKRPFVHRAYFNARLKTTGGRYHLKDHHLDFNPRLLNLDETVLIGIIKHELCHYHLHLTGQGFEHKDETFKKLLVQVGGLRYTPRLEVAKYHYQCQDCGQLYHRQRKMNLRRYCCGKCKGRLQFVQNDEK
ncbi:SprT family protein [Enterococcus columbae]|uniref:SprT-like domain-containing protein n=1 Tax=Enterococcus columbae DSM 7374 = ATCC 51263 TaxID=1121865 RepID=S1N666_9ENTE|nr:SprT family protein [Enterococcus columbae]EOT44324.1 hypothetical protein OMW_00380 [Enterococcus columbae DSM 7374 = ATCC 51263]EOW84482.1 hypothetical protein I568_00978 [Enterococcus columbae DSM 7374 = ATCC 51263]